MNLIPMNTAHWAVKARREAGVKQGDSGGLKGKARKLKSWKSVPLRQKVPDRR